MADSSCFRKTGTTAFMISTFAGLTSPDDLKLRSSMTLFAHAAEDPAPFRRVLAKYYDGVEDPLTLAAP